MNSVCSYGLIGISPAVIKTIVSIVRFIFIKLLIVLRMMEHQLVDTGIQQLNHMENGELLKVITKEILEILLLMQMEMERLLFQQMNGV